MKLLFALFTGLLFSVALYAQDPISQWEGSLNAVDPIYREGSVIIGSDSFLDDGIVYKFSVNGNMRAKSIKVYTGWADFVFEKDYVLPSLMEVERHILQYGHLKDIPSAAEVDKNGIELGEMNKLLLQKVEELTLYVIMLNKEIEELKKEK